MLVRATMPNPDGLLIDGALVSVVLEAGKPGERVVIPQSALIADQQGIYVFVVEDGKAAVRRITVGDEDFQGAREKLRPSSRPRPPAAADGGGRRAGDADSSPAAQPIAE